VPSRVKARFRNELVPRLKERLGYTNAMALPRLDKIVVSIGIGKYSKEKEGKPRIDAAIRDLITITGQKPRTTIATRAVAGFSLREGQQVGLVVTLRGDRMYDFFDRLINVAIPRVRDFQGLPRRSFDDAGNYSLGIAEHVVFPEIDINQVTGTQGMNVTLGIRARKKDDAVALMEELGLPLRKN
jgi:large subunit ribosomal protein L5